MFKIIIVALVVTIAGLFVLTKIDPSNSQNSQGNISTISQAQIGEGQIKVVITGQIVYPGEYICNKTDTLGSLILKAGGTLDDADKNAFNEDLVIGDLNEFYISPISKAQDTCVIENITKVNINTADSKSLQKIGLSATLADSVISYRQANGNFKSIEEIKKVSGIGTKTFQNIRDYITIK